MNHNINSGVGFSTYVVRILKKRLCSLLGQIISGGVLFLLKKYTAFFEKGGK